MRTASACAEDNTRDAPRGSAAWARYQRPRQRPPAETARNRRVCGAEAKSRRAGRIRFPAGAMVIVLCEAADRDPEPHPEHHGIRDRRLDRAMRASSLIALRIEFPAHLLDGTG